MNIRYESDTNGSRSCWGLSEVKQSSAALRFSKSSLSEVLKVK